ncbi:2-amino-4-hydroxy-6-hydroxymethyldihydropteridine diphosphokinase [Chryseolinea lacunae]|uniref:2-amino-4-hydroxy-6-hydroxymethyldihydropteridine pyrophosphokinase n=1 Tax=Chryseolinea lacunae TaxID=2801331 RepID=A0ABS1KZP9_9BACT|nr:2-amino-4-hydroxy-6-hydroxymethyldihydropteridine diphosphokinase [Chryseolinea lacunae]MBL0744940.1 2-amino-4-hydroxy-6-hydroxymethyldihydropteridine diphosphokinase [Chryseolinea lacunae]
MNNAVFLLLGTNLGSRRDNLNAAVRAIENEIGKIVRASSVYETAAWGKTDQPSFYNQVLEIETALLSTALMTALLAVETQLGRERHERWGERIIDVDMLYYGQEIVSTQRLTLPHPQLQNRRFTLVPLCEIAPEFVHPVFQKTNRELLDKCPDQLAVNIVQS